jgi:hypothetical protein
MSAFVYAQRIVFRRFEPVRSRLLLYPRHAATKAAPSAPSVPKPVARVQGGPKDPNSAGRLNYNPPIRQQGRLFPQQGQKAFAAQRLYEQGLRNLYTAPSHTGTLAISWAIATFCVGNTLRMFWEGFYELREGHGLSYAKRTAVETGNRLTMILFTVVGGYALLRYRGLVKALDLVKSSTSGTPDLQISVRRIIPFLPPKKYVVPPQDLRLPQKWRLRSERWPEPEPERTSLIRSIGRTMGWPFKKFKDYLVMDGILAVNFHGGQTNALLDTRGDFVRTMAYVEAITTEIQPWDR